MRITALYRYPVKSLRGSAEESLEIEPWGPVGDRRWALVDESGAVVTARTEPSLLGYVAEADDDGGIRVLAPGGERLAVAAPYDGPQVRTAISRVPLAMYAGQDAQRFFSQRLGAPVRLVWQADPRIRPVNPTNGGVAGEVLSLADAGPLQLASEVSLAQLQDWVGTSPVIDMLRFRPNVVIDGEVAFAEDSWPFVRLGRLDFRVQHACDRCVMTTFDPTTLTRGPEPIRTLARHRKWDGKTWFGVWIVPQSTGRLHVGDAVQCGDAASVHRPEESHGLRTFPGARGVPAQRR